MRAMWILLGLAVLALLVMLSGAPWQWGGVVLIGPIPIVLASSPTMAALTIGMTIVLIVVAMLFMYASTLPLRHEMPTEEEPPERAPKKRVEGGAVIMIGPIPLVIGSDRRMALLAMVLALALMVMWLILLLLL